VPPSTLHQVYLLPPSALTLLLLFRYADRCYASFDHTKQRERDTGTLVLCCVSLFSAYPVIGRSDMDKLRGKGNFQNYDAHVIPVVPADSSNPRELTYFPCEAPSLHSGTHTCMNTISHFNCSSSNIGILRFHVHGTGAV
jgi:hypothetical protein